MQSGWDRRGREKVYRGIKWLGACGPELNSAADRSVATSMGFYKFSGVHVIFSFLIYPLPTHPPSRLTYTSTMYVSLSNILTAPFKRSRGVDQKEQEVPAAIEDHAYIRGDHSIRSPCPGLNALANQGYM